MSIVLITMRLVVIDSQQVLCDGCNPFRMQKGVPFPFFEFLLIELSTDCPFCFSILINFRFNIVIINFELQHFIVSNRICDNVVMKLISKTSCVVSPVKLFSGKIGVPVNPNKAYCLKAFLRRFCAFPNWER